MDPVNPVLTKRIRLTPAELDDIDGNIRKRLAENYEGKCTNDQYIDHIVTIVKRSSGEVDRNSFTGNIIYDVYFQINSVKIVPGDILFDCQITMIKRSGIFLVKNNFIQIFITSKNLEPEFETKYSVNQKYNVYVLGVNMSNTQRKVQIIGKIHYYHIRESLMLLNLISEELTVNGESRRDLRNDLDSAKKDPISSNSVDSELWDYYTDLTDPFNTISNKYSRTYYSLWEIFNYIKKTPKKIVAFEEDTVFKRYYGINPEKNSTVSDLIYLNRITEDNIKKAVNNVTKDGTLILRMTHEDMENIGTTLLSLMQRYHIIEIYKPKISPDTVREAFILGFNAYEKVKNIEANDVSIKEKLNVFAYRFNKIYTFKIWEIAEMMKYNLYTKLSEKDYEIYRKKQEVMAQEWFRENSFKTSE